MENILWSVPEGNYILLFTMVGMKTQEVTLKNQTELNIIMQHETSEMDEVVITGYFNQAKNSFTGAAVPLRPKSCKQEATKIS